jgi:hypothetical protein
MQGVLLVLLETITHRVHQGTILRGLDRRQMNSDLSGKLALIIGGSRSRGEATANQRTARIWTCAR